jgi:4-hydroxymandelate oxidase
MELGGIEALARDHMDPVAFDYVGGGAADEITVNENVTAWAAMRLHPHMLRDVSAVSTATTVLGIPVALPVLVAPTAMHRLFHADGERATARGVADAGTVYVLSNAATTALEDVAAVAPTGSRWMQLYVQRDRGRTRSVCERAAAAGYTALVVTVDSPVTAKNTRNQRNAFNVPSGLTLPNMAPPGEGTPDIYQLVAAYDPTVTVADIARIAEWGGGLPVVVKGVLRGDDAAACVDAGAAGIAVSNHGGRQLDTCVATAHALEGVVQAVGGRAEVYVDGGIRHGTDVLKALALGARAVAVGRMVPWALAIDGSAGVTAMLRELGEDLARAMAFCGITDVTAVPRDLVTP